MNKCQEALNELKDLVHSELDGTKMLNKHLVYCNTLQDLIDQNKPLTLAECIKEWKDRGFEIIEQENYIIFRHHKTYKTIEIYLVNLSYKTYEWYDEKRPIADKLNIDEAQSITYDIHNLITKTLKALEVENG